MDGMGALCFCRNFNPRPPVRGATIFFPGALQGFAISIHAPLCGGRPVAIAVAKPVVHISIHAPLCGGRPLINQLVA